MVELQPMVGVMHAPMDAVINMVSKEKNSMKGPKVSFALLLHQQMKLLGFATVFVFSQVIG